MEKERRRIQKTQEECKKQNNPIETEYLIKVKQYNGNKNKAFRICSLK